MNLKKVALFVVFVAVVNMILDYTYNYLFEESLIVSVIFFILTSVIAYKFIIYEE